MAGWPRSRRAASAVVPAMRSTSARCRSGSAGRGRGSRPRRSAVAQRLGRGGGVVEVAVAAEPVGPGVVAGRPAERIGEARPATIAPRGARSPMPTPSRAVATAARRPACRAPDRAGPAPPSAPARRALARERPQIVGLVQRAAPLDLLGAGVGGVGAHPRWRAAPPHLAPAAGHRRSRGSAPRSSRIHGTARRRARALLDHQQRIARRSREVRRIRGPSGAKPLRR